MTSGSPTSIAVAVCSAARQVLLGGRRVDRPGVVPEAEARAHRQVAGGRRVLDAHEGPLQPGQPLFPEDAGLRHGLAGQRRHRRHDEGDQRHGRGEHRDRGAPPARRPRAVAPRGAVHWRGSTSRSSRSCARTYDGATSSAGQRLPLGVVRDARLLERLAEVGVGAGAILRAGGNRDPERLERRRQLAVGERKAAELGVRRGVERIDGHDLGQRRLAAGGVGRPSSSADQLAGRRRRRCDRWRSGSRAPAAAPALSPLASSSAAMRACGLPSPVAIGTSAAARSIGGQRRVGVLGLLERAPERHLHREAAGVGAGQRCAAARAARRPRSPRASSSAWRSPPNRVVEEAVEGLLQVVDRHLQRALDRRPRCRGRRRTPAPARAATARRSAPRCARPAATPRSRPARSVRGC